MSAADFLAENNACGQTLLQLVSRGHAIIAEHLRLSDFVPSVFLCDTSDSSSKTASNTAVYSLNSSAKYRELICDFSYFKISEQFEAKIEGNMVLQDLDEEMRENYLEILTRFYLAFESVYRYAIDLERYIEDLEEGTFIQQTIETVLMNIEGKQLMAEAIYLLGTMLLGVDSNIEGPVRERLLVSFYRYSSRRASAGAHIDDVCRLFRDTGKTKNRRPPNYPESYFQRVRLNKTALAMVIGRLRSDDIYNQMTAFPLPDHRSTALASQAAMLHICLYFTPQILNNETSVMREIVDKYFSDNWVISGYMGRIVNLIEAWEPYKAAKAALACVHSPTNLKMLVDRHLRELQDVNTGLIKFLTEGTLTKEFILDNTNKILASLRRCNVTLKWLMLHSLPLRSEWESVKKCNQLREVLISDTRFNTQSVFALLLNSAQFELTVKEKFREMLNSRQKECNDLKKDISERIYELAEVFSGAKPLARVPKNEKLQAWFTDMRGQIDQLTFDNVFNVGGKLVQLMRSLEEVQEFYSLDVNAQIRQFLAEVRQVMHQLLRTLSMKEDTLVQMQTICDVSYAWEIIDNYTDNMQKGIRKDATMASRLRAVFIKLSSCLDLPLLRIQQSNSPDLVSVSQFYSRLLVLYIRRVLHVIPETVFSLLAQVVELQTSKIEELPTRLDKAKLKEYAKLDERYEVARLTHGISVLTEGVLMMKVTLVGSIRVDPKQLLEDGIRKELVQKVATAMHSSLIFNTKAKHQPNLLAKLDSLATQLDGYRRSFEYISDYIGLPGLMIWQEEFTRIVNYTVEQECNTFVRRKVQDWESVYQSKLIPIPRFAPVDNHASFVGRLAAEIMKETDPKTTTYVHAVATWYDNKTRKEVINPQLFKLLLKAVGNIGTAGLDRLYSFMIVHHVQRWSQNYVNIIDNQDINTALDNVMTTIGSSNRTVDQPAKVYSSLITKFSKSLAPLCDGILKVGHMQIIRLHILRELNNVCKFQSKLLEHSLRTLSDVVVFDTRSRSSNLQSENEDALLYELTTYLEAAGMTDPLQKLYVPPTSLPKLELVSFLLLLIHMPKLAYVKNIGLISRKPADALDGVPFIIGMITLLRQFGSNTIVSFIQFVGQSLNSFVHTALSTKTEIPNDAAILMKYIIELASFSNISIKELGDYVPRILIDEHQVLF